MVEGTTNAGGGTLVNCIFNRQIYVLDPPKGLLELWRVTVGKHSPRLGKLRLERLHDYQRLGDQLWRRHSSKSSNDDGAC